jgi:hypothetical protein
VARITVARRAGADRRVRPPASKPAAGELSFTVAIAICFWCVRSLLVWSLGSDGEEYEALEGKWVGGRREKGVG